MKVSMLFLNVLVLVLSGCMNSASDKIREFIPGTYVRQIHNEFTNGADTLVITEYDHTGGVYFVENKTGYQQQLDGKVFSPQYKVKKWTAVYDEKTHQLNIQKRDEFITFLPDQNKLLDGRTEFLKVSKD